MLHMQNLLARTFVHVLSHTYDDKKEMCMAMHGACVEAFCNDAN